MRYSGPDAGAGAGAGAGVAGGAAVAHPPVSASAAPAARRRTPAAIRRSFLGDTLLGLLRGGRAAGTAARKVHVYNIIPRPAAGGNAPARPRPFRGLAGTRTHATSCARGPRAILNRRKSSPAA